MSPKYTLNVAKVSPHPCSLLENQFTLEVITLLFLIKTNRMNKPRKEVVDTTGFSLLVSGVVSHATWLHVVKISLNS